MVKTIIQRLFQMIIVMLIVTILVFLMTYKISNPVYLMLPSTATAEQVEAVSEQLGLNKPLYVQYGIFLKNVLHGNFGNSYFYNQPAVKIIFEKMPATLELVFVTMILTVLIGIPLGVFAGAAPKRLTSRATMTLSIFGVSLPSFWIGMIMIYIFSLALHLTPVSGRGQVGTIFGIKTSLATLDGWRHAILPAITLALGNIASIVRLTKAGTQEQMQQDYVKFARSKGVSNGNVLFGHALKNTMIPVVTILGLQLGDLIAFTTITETIFVWPGMGKMALDAISKNDRPIISAYLLMVSAMFIIINFIVDVLYTIIDPRVSLGDD